MQKSMSLKCEPTRRSDLEPLSRTQGPLIKTQGPLIKAQGPLIKPQGTLSNLKALEDFFLKAKALTVLHVPYSLDSGTLSPECTAGRRAGELALITDY